MGLARLWGRRGRADGLRRAGDSGRPPRLPPRLVTALRVLCLFVSPSLCRAGGTRVAAPPPPPAARPATPLLCPNGLLSRPGLSPPSGLRVRTYIESYLPGAPRSCWRVLAGGGVERPPLKTLDLLGDDRLAGGADTQRRPATPRRTPPGSAPARAGGGPRARPVPVLSLPLSGYPCGSSSPESGGGGAATWLFAVPSSRLQPVSSRGAGPRGCRPALSRRGRPGRAGPRRFLVCLRPSGGRGPGRGGPGPPCAFEMPMITAFCNSHWFSQLAAFFIGARAE